MVSVHPLNSIILSHGPFSSSCSCSSLQFPWCPASSRLLYPMFLSISMLQLQFQFPFWNFFQRRMRTWPNLITKYDLEVNSHDWWFSRYSLVLVAMFNVWDLISRYIPLVECLKLESRKGLIIATLSRFLLVPAFYFTAKYGDQGWMIMLTSFLGLTNGYLSVCVLTEAPKGYKGPEQNALGNLLVLCLFAGIFSGVVLDWLWLIGKWFLKNRISVQLSELESFKWFLYLGRQQNHQLTCHTWNPKSS